MRLEIKKLYKSKYFHCAVLLLLLTLSIFLVLPYLTVERRSGHDLRYHFTVIRSLSVAWDNGSFGGKVMELIGGDYGYGTGIFYSTMPASVCVILMKAFAMNMPTALFVEMLLLFFLSATAVYFFLFRVFGDKRTALIGGVVYAVTPYFMWDLYTRFAFTEIFLTLALPLIVWGVYELLYKNNRILFLALFVPGYVLAIFSHFTMTVYITLFVGLWLLLEYKKTFQKKTLAYFALGTCIVLLLTASYYIPMLINFGVTDTASMKKTPEQMFTNTSKYYTERILSLDFSFIVCAFLGYLFYYYKILDKSQRTVGKRTLLLSSALVLALYNPYFPWAIMPDFLLMIQYTFRVFVIAGITTPLMLGCMVQDIFFQQKASAESVADTAFETPKTEAENLPVQHAKKNRIPAILLSICLAFCGIFAYVHNTEIMDTLDNSSGGTYGDNALLEVTGYSEFFGLGAGKHGDYYPIDCDGSYVSKRVKNQLVRSSEVNVTEIAVYDGLQQVSFLISKVTKETKNKTVILNAPYTAFEGVEVFRVETNMANKPLEISAEPTNNGKNVRLVLAEYGGDSKVVLSYKNSPAFKAWLSEKAVGVITVEGDAVATNFEKEYAGKYAFSVVAGEETSVLELPSFYYEGYQVTFTGADGKTQTLTPMHGRNGFVEVTVEESGSLFVQFTSGYLTASYVMTWCGAVALAGALVLTIVLDCKRKKE